MISIIVPVYKVEDYLDRCVNSLLNQTYRDIEIILVDDGSPDRCPELCDQWAARDHRIRVIHKENGGLSDARNVGLEAAKGEWIQFVDSDDYVSPNMCEMLVRTAVGCQAQIANCNFYWTYYDKHGAMETKPYSSPVTNGQQVLSGTEAVQFYFLRGGVNLGVTWSKLFRREIFGSPRKLRFPVGALHEDQFTTYKFFHEAERVVVIKEPLYYYVQRSGSIMDTYGPKNVEWSKCFIRDYLMWYKTEAPEFENIMKYAAVHHYISLLRVCAIKPNLATCLPSLQQFGQEVRRTCGDMGANPFFTRKMRLKIWLMDHRLLIPIWRVKEAMR